MLERHFHFHSVVMGRLHAHPAAFPQLQKESECAPLVRYQNIEQVLPFKPNRARTC